MKLKYYIKDGIKVYTLKEAVNGEKTKDAHYKFIRLPAAISRRLNKNKTRDCS